MDKLAHYSKQSIVHPWPYDIHIGDDSTISIPSSGDIMHTAHLKITWPSDAPALTAPATALIDFMELLYDGEVIERVYGENMYINNDLEVPTAKQPGLSNLIGPSMTTFYIQLPFTILDTGLPLCALDQQPKLRVVFNKRASTYTKPIKTELLVEYVYIPQKELEYMKTHTLTYSTRSYQRLQFVVGAGTSNVSVLSEFVNDVNELYWVVQNTGADGVYDYGGRDSVRSVRLTFNGSDVLVPEIGTGQYLRVVQPLQHHARVSSNYYYMYSFVCPVNMSKVLRQQHTINLIENGYERRVTLYAKSLNEFRVGNGIGHMRDKMRESGSLVSTSVGVGYNIVSTLAGRSTGLPAFSDGTGTNTKFFYPEGITYDGQGNLYICDTRNSVIRKIVIATRAVTTIAGLAATAGSTDATGPAARFNRPARLIYVGGNLYICDTDNHTIRKLVVATGEVTTIAGLAGSSGSTDATGSVARFYFPKGIAYDGSGNLYICDTGNYTIRKLVISTGAVTTISGLAGTQGSTDAIGLNARFSEPTDITYDGSANLYICDFKRTSIRYSNIRKLTIATGEVSTFAGSSTTYGSSDGIGSAASFFLPVGITYDGLGNLYVCDYNTIRIIVISSGAVTTLAGGVYGANTDISVLGQVVYDGLGNLYICDYDNWSIKKFTISVREVITFAGSDRGGGYLNGIGGKAVFQNVYRIVYDGLGNLYITEANNIIRKLVISSGAVTTIAGLAGSSGSTDGNGETATFYEPLGITYDGQGNLFICDSQNHTIRKVVISSGAVTTIAGLAGSSGSDDGIGSVARFNLPNGITCDGQGNLFICDRLNDAIRKLVISTGAVTTIAGLSGNPGSADGIGTNARFKGPNEIVYDGQGNLFISDTSNHTIRKLVISSGAVTTIAGLAGSSGSADGIGSNARFLFQIGITCDGQGNLFICDYQNRTIRKLVIATQTVTTIAGLAGSQNYIDGAGSDARFAGPDGITYDGNGNLYVCDRPTYTIRKIIL